MITPDRAVALYHLRMNPNSHKQARGDLMNCKGERCALGLIAEAFNLPLHAGPYHKLNAEAYRALDQRLGNRHDYIYILNDSYRLNFAEIADVMEELWTTSDSFYDVKQRRGLKRVNDDNA